MYARIKGVMFAGGVTEVPDLESDVPCREGSNPSGAKAQFYTPVNYICKLSNLIVHAAALHPN